MPDRRARIRLTEDEQRELLESVSTLSVASISADGTPHLVPMWFVLDDDGAIAFTTYARAQKVSNLERDPRLTVMAEAGVAYNELRGVSIDAEAELVRDPRVTARILQLVAAKQSGRPRPEPVADAGPPAQATKRVTVIVRPRRVRSWDHRKL